MPGVPHGVVGCGVCHGEMPNLFSLCVAHQDAMRGVRLALHLHLMAIGIWCF